MAKRKDLLLTEATTMRMMGLAGIGSLANPFLKENYGDLEEGKCKSCGGKMKEGMCESCGSMKEGEELEEMADSMYEEDSVMEEELDDLEEGEDLEEGSAEELNEDEDPLYEGEEELDEGEELDESGLVRNVGSSGSTRTPSQMRKFGKISNKKKNDSKKSEKSDNDIKEGIRKLKRLLEEAEDLPPPEAASKLSTAEAPPALEGEDPMESKIKEFVKKLGDLIQETLGVQVTVEEGGDEESQEALPPPAGGAEAPPPAPMAEAINRLVNKVARRVKARLMEAKKNDPKAAAKAKLMKEKQAAAKKKEEEAAAKKKEMMMKKKKAAALKAKKK